ncbi:MAG: glycosyltransferase family 4 protein [Candidatus Burarchaeum sp.]|nr:glycosyltransferase family 4 protein [Candidatus Burarchaeum sp.]MDO8339970.1 glycosyltransferase family 4 protein [Candidatus Burarchaeum sp.]
MNIAYFVWEYPPRLVGGLGTYADEITKQYAEMGHELTVFTMNDGGKLPTNEEKGRISIHRPVIVDSSSIIPVFVDEELRRWGDGLHFFSDVLNYNILSAHKFINRTSKDKKFDLIACHDWLSAMGGVVSKANTKIPMVFHVHSTEYGRSAGGGSSTIKDLEYSTARQANMIVTVSYAMQEEIQKLNFPADKIRVMWNGVDEEKYNIKNFKQADLDAHRKSLGVGENDKMILFTGRLTFVKGIDTLVRAMGTVAAQQKSAKLVVLGRGEMADEIKMLASQMGITDRVIMVDRWVDEKERLLLYACCDVMCSPSRYEPFGIVPLEAMSMGKPVVVGVGGMRESVVDGEQGFFCDPNNPQDITDKLLRILKDEKLAKQMGRKARERVEKVFTWKRIAKQTIELYETII